MIFFTADTHFGHKNIIKYSYRPFSSVTEMEETIVHNWNSRVKQDDTVYHLGDFAFVNKSEKNRLLHRLNGNICLIKGNHDKKLNAELRSKFCWIKDYHEITGPNKVKIVLCHYAFDVWNKSHHGSWHLHGHSHGMLPPGNRMRVDVGVDTNGFHLYSMKDIELMMEYRKADKL